MKKFLLIGNGNMGKAFTNLLHKDYKMTIASPNTKPLYKANYVRDVKDLKPEKFDVITFAIKPKVLPTILKDLKKENYGKHTKFISLVAGARIELFNKYLGEDADVSTVMTNLPINVGKGVLAIYPPDKKVPDLEKLGSCVYVKNQDDIDKFCALVGCGSGFVYRILELYDTKSDCLNFETSFDKKKVVMDLFQGSLDYLTYTGNSFEEGKNNVINPGGPTDLGIKELNKGEDVYEKCFNKAYRRTEEIGKEVNKEVKIEKEFN